MKLLVVTALVATLVLAAETHARSGPKLPLETLRGLAHRLDQYPTLSLATPEQRLAAQQLLADLRPLTVRRGRPR